MNGATVTQRACFGKQRSEGDVMAPASDERPQQIRLPRDHQCAEYGAPGAAPQNDLVFPERRAKCFGPLETVLHQIARKSMPRPKRCRSGPASSLRRPDPWRNGVMRPAVRWRQF